MKVFVDTDVILDVLLERKNFIYSSKIIEYIENKQINGFTSPVILTNIFFLISKDTNNKLAWDSLRRMRLLFKISKINQEIVDLALASGFKDFEDALQYYSAISSNIKYLITRNKSDYKGEEIMIVSPQEFLALLDKN